MGLSRRRDSSMIWPGFVDAVTTLLMVMMFVLTIFTVMQAVLRDTITTQGNELAELNAQVAQLADALGLERARADSLQASLTNAEDRIGDFEIQVRGLLDERDAALGDVARLGDEKSALEAALAGARSEIDAAAEAARLAAARREALEALVADLQAKGKADAAALVAAEAKISEAEAARLVDAAALAALRDKLKASDDELAALTLALEARRKEAEEVLTLLAAARAKPPEGAEKGTLLDVAKATLSEEQEKAIAAERKLALLNEQIAALRTQLGQLQGLLEASSARDAAAQVQLENLGSQLNAALAQVAAEQKRRAELEEAERKRLEAENADLARFRSEFFGQLSQVLAGREGVRVVGDRFVFSSEVLFTPGAADLAAEGRAQIAGVVATLTEVAGQIPPGIDWIIRVDGHTDNVPLSGAGAFADNWELSQARALSVVRYMVADLGFPPARLAATGFGEFQPVATGDSAEARAQNRRIELKLTER
ncbi:peptidoglycan -binding protein [Tabrizicola oligotrophica]|uniref:Peptidoglycan-binding protein n=1 Tax=Tabrizicola oligotrophica TaxID=2710650 RepID=A0A6M0QTC7_9RHOB|nr:peptidoglycan -binding protein [Tabrizicola oligotrophica]NEY90706.1 peptidoglycan -binding protein [Tabrizicola oligotrophica]